MIRRYSELEKSPQDDYPESQASLNSWVYFIDVPFVLSPTTYYIYNKKALIRQDISGIQSF